MSNFECGLNRRFWRSKKVVQVVQIGGRGGGEVIWTKSKRTAAFFRDVFPKMELVKKGWAFLGLVLPAIFICTFFNKK